MLRTVSVFWDTECILNFFARGAAAIGDSSMEPFTFRESTLLQENEKIGYSSFAEFLAVVIYPHAFTQFWLYEFYAMGMPLFVPSIATLPLYLYQDYAGCPDFEGHRSGHIPTHPYSPFNRDNWNAITYWTNFTDFVQLPHLQRFNSVPQLIFELETFDGRAQ